ncbi:MAG: 50S ribosomal protein L23 [Patescibacteria group bacterium]|jgi:large subunit ribosomal protein L23
MGILSRFQKEKEAPEKKSIVTAQNKVQADAENPAETSDVKTPVAEKKTTKKATKKEAAPEKKPAYTMLSEKVTKTLLRPVVSEKSAHMADENVLVFDVAVNANRIAIKQAFKELYHVMPIRVNLVNIRGKHIRFGRSEGKQSNRKKAYIAVPKGTHIDIFEGV